MSTENQEQEMPQWAQALMESNRILLEKVKELEQLQEQAQDPEDILAQKVLDKLQENEAKKKEDEAIKKRYSQIVNDIMK